MQFLSPWMLWGLGALAAPILIHLWQRRRVVVLPFSTLRYLRIVAAKTSRSAKLENILLLLLRCLIFALLAFAASRPVVSKKALGLLGGNVQRTVVMIVDHSGSMGYRTGDHTRLEVARDQALAVLDSLRAGDEAAVLTADSGVQAPVALPTLDRGVAHSAIAGVQPGQGSTNFLAALAAARDLLAKSTKPVKEVYLFTDDQADGWTFDPKVVFNEAWTKADPTLVVIRPDEATAINAAVTGVKITSPLVTQGSLVDGSVSVRNFSSAPLHDLLQISLGGTQVASLPVEGGPDGVTDVPFEFQMPATAGGSTARGIAKIQGDNLPLDDQRFFTVLLHQSPRVVIFEGQAAGPERLRSGYFLKRALAAGMMDAETPTFDASALEDTPLGGYSAVFLADVPRLSDRAAVKLDTFAKTGGTVVLLPGDTTDLPSLAKVDFLPAKAGTMHELPAGRLSSQITDALNPLFADTWGPGTPFPPLPQRKLAGWTVKPGAKTLVSAGGSAPFLIAGDDEAGRVYIINASPDRAWGDFPLSPAFLPLVQQIALQSSERGLGSVGYTVGQPVPAGPVLPRDQTLTVTLPDGSTQAVLIGQKANLLDATGASGFYQVGTAREPSLLTIPVNVDPQESELTPITDEALGRITPHESVAGMDNLRRWLSQSRGMLPLWPTLVALAALAFALESVYSTPRRAAPGAGRGYTHQDRAAQQAEGGQSVPGRRAGGGGGMNDLLFHPVLPWPLLTGLVAAVIALTGWSLVVGLRDWKRRVALLVLRLLAIAALVFALCQPQEQREEVTILRPQVAVLVDNSLSMNDPVDDHQPHRSERVQEFLNSPAVAQARKDFDFRVFTLDGSEQPADHPQPAFAANASNVISGIGELQGHFRGQPLAAVLLLTDGLDTSGAAKPEAWRTPCRSTRSNSNDRSPQAARPTAVGRRGGLSAARRHRLAQRHSHRRGGQRHVRPERARRAVAQRAEDRRRGHGVQRGRTDAAGQFPGDPRAARRRAVRGARHGRGGGPGGKELPVFHRRDRAGQAGALHPEPAQFRLQISAQGHHRQPQLAAQFVLALGGRAAGQPRRPRAQGALDLSPQRAGEQRGDHPRRPRAGRAAAGGPGKTCAISSTAAAGWSCSAGRIPSLRPN